MSRLRSRIGHFEVQKTLQVCQSPLNFFANLGTCGAPFMMLNVVRTMQLKGLHHENFRFYSFVNIYTARFTLEYNRSLSPLLSVS
jgi:hypothetical protein